MIIHSDQTISRDPLTKATDRKEILQEDINSGKHNVVASNLISSLPEEVTSTSATMISSNDLTMIHSNETISLQNFQDLLILAMEEATQNNKIVSFWM